MSGSATGEDTALYIRLVLGFATLVTGELRSQAEFGLLAAATLVVAWVLDLSFTPALARRFGIARR